MAAIVAARFLRGLVSRACCLGLDRRLGEQAGGEPEVSVSTAVSEASFWLTLLLFLPAILGVLAIDGLTDPVGNMVDRVLVFAPNLVAAAVILGVGVLAARVLRRIVANLAQSVGADAVGERVGLTGDNGTQRLSDLLGLVVYALILIPVIVSALNALQIDAVAERRAICSTACSRPFRAFSLRVRSSHSRTLPDASSPTSSRACSPGPGSMPCRSALGAEPDAAGMTPSRIVGSLVFAAIVIAAAMEAVNALGFERLSDLTGQFVVFGGQLLFGLAIVAVGLFIANVAANAVAASAVGRARTMALITRVVIIAFAVALGLQEVGIANEIVMLAFGIPLGALALAAAVAVGVGAGISLPRNSRRCAMRSAGTPQSRRQSEPRSPRKQERTPGTRMRPGVRVPWTRSGARLPGWTCGHAACRSRAVPAERRGVGQITGIGLLEPDHRDHLALPASAPAARPFA